MKRIHPSACNPGDLRHQKSGAVFSPDHTVRQEPYPTVSSDQQPSVYLAGQPETPVTSWPPSLPPSPGSTSFSWKQPTHRSTDFWVIFWMLLVGEQHPNSCWLLLHSAILRAWALTARMSYTVLNEWLNFYSTLFNSHWNGVLAVLFGSVLHSWCYIKLLPSRCTFCLHHTTMHQFTVSLHSKPHMKGACVF